MTALEILLIIIAIPLGLYLGDKLRKKHRKHGKQEY